MSVTTTTERRSTHCPYCDDVVRDGCLYAHGCVGNGRQVAEPLPPRRRPPAPAPRTRLDPPVKRCEAYSRRTGGACDLPLDAHGYCPRVSDHIEEEGR